MGLKLSFRASNSRYSYRRGRNEKNESRMVFEKLKAAFFEHLTHTKIHFSKSRVFEKTPF